MPLSVYVTRRIPEPALDRLRQACEKVEANPHDRSLTREELLAAVPGRDGVLCMLTDGIDEKVIDAAGPACRVFANYAVGFNNIDLAAATRRGIWVTNTPGVLTETTADLAWSLMLGIARRVVEADRFLRTGRWREWAPMELLGRDVHGATLGIVGAGRIGTAVGLRSTGFRMQVLYVDPSENEELNGIGGRRVDLDTVLRESDFLSLHVPLQDQTHHLIGGRELAMMKPTAYLINTSRGPVIDEQALVAALHDGRIAGAGLDVYENEPNLTPGLIELNNVLCLPHLGSASEATRTRMALMAAEDLLAAIRGQEPAHAVNRVD